MTDEYKMDAKAFLFFSLHSKQKYSGPHELASFKYFPHAAMLLRSKTEKHPHAYNPAISMTPLYSTHALPPCPTIASTCSQIMPFVLPASSTGELRQEA